MRKIFMAKKSRRTGKVSKMRAQKTKGEYHHAILGLTAVIIFLFIGIAMQFNVRATGFVVASGKTSDFTISQSFSGMVEDCQPFQDNNNPYEAGYVVHSGSVVSTDACLDQSMMIEYSCDSAGRLRADIGTCQFGCVKAGTGGYCR